MAIVADRVKETTSTTGTANIVLAGAVSGFRTFNTAIGQNVPFYYALLDSNGTSWETGSGYLISPTALVRDRIHVSTNGNAAINLTSGTHTVFCSLTADPIRDLQGKSYASARGFDMP
jgi:hypothetical protein